MEDVAELGQVCPDDIPVAVEKVQATSDESARKTKSK
jgi:hypothetical protein